MLNVPMVIKQTPYGERAYDISSLLIENRIIVLTGEINDSTAEVVTSCLLYLDSTEDAPISLYINSPGGSVTAGFAIYDTMRTIKSPVHTYCTGVTASMGAILFIAGDRRFMMPNAELMLHQPLGGAQGQSTDVMINARHLEDTKKRITKLIAYHTDQDVDHWEPVLERDTWFDADEALMDRLADEIMEYTEKGTPGKETE